jgi:hypothetical protein
VGNLRLGNLTKEEPTKNEVVTCYNEVLIEGNGLDNIDVQNKMPQEQSNTYNSKKNFHDYHSVSI